MLGEWVGVSQVCAGGWGLATLRTPTIFSTEYTLSDSLEAEEDAGSDGSESESSSRPDL